MRENGGVKPEQSTTLHMQCWEWNSKPHIPFIYYANSWDKSSSLFYPAKVFFLVVYKSFQSWVLSLIN